MGNVSVRYMNNSQHIGIATDALSHFFRRLLKGNPVAIEWQNDKNVKITLQNNVVNFISLEEVEHDVWQYFQDGDDNCSKKYISTLISDVFELLKTQSVTLRYTKTYWNSDKLEISKK